MAGLFHGHVVEYPQLRIDCFTTPRRPAPYPPPAVLPLPPASSKLGEGLSSKEARPLELDVFPPASLYLLTHAHSVRPSLAPLSSRVLRPLGCSQAARST